MSITGRKVTVLMSLYNDSEYAAQSIKSVLNQTYKDFEFLIIDDGSKDNIDEVISEFNDSRILYEKIPHKGLAGALNHGLKKASGDLIARVDADDLILPERLHSQLEFLKQNPGYNVIGTWSVYFKDPARILFHVKTPTEDNEIKKFLYLHNPINHSSVIFDKKVISEAGGYNETFSCYEDFELWSRLKNKLQFKILPEIHVFTRLRENSLTRKGSKNKIYNLLKIDSTNALNKTSEENEKQFYTNLLFWIEYFYGDKKRARKYLTGGISFRQAIAFLNTFLPERAFDKIMGLRLRYRIQTKFTDSKKFKSELEMLMNL